MIKYQVVTTKLGEFMNYIIYSNDENIANAYVYDSSKHVKKGEEVTQIFRFGDFEFPSTTYRNKNKLSRSNGCLTTIDKSNINFKDTTFRLIELPKSISPSTKFVISFRGENGKFIGLKISFKKIQSYDAENGKVIYNGGLIMRATCQDHDWVVSHSSDDLEKDISHNGYYLGEYISNNQTNFLDYLSKANAPKI